MADLIKHERLCARKTLLSRRNNAGNNSFYLGQAKHSFVDRGAAYQLMVQQLQ